MCDVVEISDDEDYSMPSNDLSATLKGENLDYDFPSDNISPRPSAENVASSSGTNLRSSFLGMGFAPALVDKAVEEHGEGNAELLLETLFGYSNHQQPKPEPCDDGLSSCSSDGLTAKHHVKEEPGFALDGKKESLLKMNFTMDEVNLAMGRLGEHAAVGQLMDFIFAMRMAKKYEKDTSNKILGDEESEKDCSNEVLFGVMEKTLQLLDMGFSENEISTAFEKCGSEAPLPELTNSIVDPTYQYRPPKRKSVEFLLNSFCIKTEDNSDLTSQVRTPDSLGKSKRKVPRTLPVNEPNDFMDPKEELAEETGSSASLACLEPRKDNPTPSAIGPGAWQSQTGQILGFEEDLKPEMFTPTPNTCRALTPSAARPPYFLYGHVTNLSLSSWAKISQFLFSVQPEFANNESHSALSRQEGYVHNLPMDDRAHILPRGPLTIQEADPHTEKWWPVWDTRKHLTHIGGSTGGATAHLVDRLARVLAESNGSPPLDLVQQLHSKNLVWMGRNRVGPPEPDLVERVMGYPLNHTRTAGLGSDQRLEWLGLAFQTDTLGYRLSVLRRLYPAGVAVLCFFTGIGGPEVALHRLGIKMRGVVSVEPVEARRRIVRRWWESSGQGGELVQMEDVKKLTGGRLDKLSRKFGGFDLIVCQNPNSGPESGVLSGLDFSMFLEFVRVLQRLRLSR